MKLFDRLKFWTVRHHLAHRLEPYKVSTPAVSTFRAASWNTLVFWAMLLDGDDEGLVDVMELDTEIPTFDEWAVKWGRVKV